MLTTIQDDKLSAESENNNAVFFIAVYLRIKLLHLGLSIFLKLL
jgi:hypothetical protein